jgi:hypothetical protein
VRLTLGQQHRLQRGDGHVSGAGGDVEQAMAGSEMACIQHQGTKCREMRKADAIAMT